MKRYRGVIEVPKQEVEEMQEILYIKDGHYKGAGKDSLIEVYSVSFENGFVADIRVCNGDTPYVDPILFAPGEHETLHEVMVLDVVDELLGGYFFEHEGVEYEVVVTTSKEEKEYKNINLDTKLKLFEFSGDFYGIVSLRGYFSDFEWYKETGIENAEIKDLLKELHVHQCFNIFPFREEETEYFKSIGEL